MLGLEQSLTTNPHSFLQSMLPQNKVTIANKLKETQLLLRWSSFYFPKQNAKYAPNMHQKCSKCKKISVGGWSDSAKKSYRNSYKGLCGLTKKQNNLPQAENSPAQGSTLSYHNLCLFANGPQGVLAAAGNSAPMLP